MPDVSDPSSPHDDEGPLSPSALAAAEARGATVLRGGLSSAGFSAPSVTEHGDGAPAGGGAASGAPAGGPPWGSAVAPSAGPPGGRGHRRRGRVLVEWAIVLVVALVVAVGVRTFVLETFYIPSGSMLPTLKVGDRIVVDKLSYDLHPVHVGDIVVFRRPPSWPKQYADLVKRVIGLPGETLWVHAGNVFVDQGGCSTTGPCTGPVVHAPGSTVPLRQLQERFLPVVDRNVTHPGPPAGPFDLAAPYTVPAGDLFVMGDNRTDSADSRYYGPVPRHDVVGEVVFRYWPLSRFGGL